jgi:hypothetical protein
MNTEHRSVNGLREALRSELAGPAEKKRAPVVFAVASKGTVAQRIFRERPPVAQPSSPQIVIMTPRTRRKEETSNSPSSPKCGQAGEK